MRLSVELVPTSCWYSNVRSNVSAPTWARISREVSMAAGRRCSICARVGVVHALECHEVWGYNDTARKQRLMELVALCPECHAVKHIGRSLSMGRGREALAWLAQVNEITPAAALEHVRVAFDVHRARSLHTWTLDVTLLSAKYGVRLTPDGQERI